jgi:hypothetical protein
MFDQDLKHLALDLGRHRTTKHHASHRVIALGR